MELNTLADTISQAISDIREGRSTPKDTKIGKLFAQLKDADATEYARLTQEYKPVAHQYFYQHPVGTKADRVLEKELLLVESVVDEEGLYETDFDEKGILVQPKKDKIIAKVKAKAKKPEPSVARDRKSFTYLGKEYGKGPLVLAIIKAPSNGRTLAEMQSAFPDTLLRGYGIFKTLAEAQEVSKVRKRYFLNDDQVVSLKCGNKIAVCNQFTSDNMGPFLKRAAELNHKVE